MNAHFNKPEFKPNQIIFNLSRCALLKADIYFFPPSCCERNITREDRGRALQSSYCMHTDTDSNKQTNSQPELTVNQTMTLIRKLLQKTAQGGKHLIRWLQRERLLANKKRCHVCHRKMNFQKTNTTKDGYRW